MGQFRKRNSEPGTNPLLQPDKMKTVDGLSLLQVLALLPHFQLTSWWHRHKLWRTEGFPSYFTLRFLETLCCTEEISPIWGSRIVSSSLFCTGEELQRAARQSAGSANSYPKSQGKNSQQLRAFCTFTSPSSPFPKIAKFPQSCQQVTANFACALHLFDLLRL